MALEINEIAIRMKVSESPLELQAGHMESAGLSEQEIDYEEIVEECVRRVLQNLKTMRER